MALLSGYTSDKANKGFQFSCTANLGGFTYGKLKEKFKSVTTSTF